MTGPKEVLALLGKSRQPLTLDDLERQLRVRAADQRKFRELLVDMVEQGEVLRLRGKKYAAAKRDEKIVTGTLQVTAKGYGFVRVDWAKTGGTPYFEGDLMVPQRHMGDALDGDVVEVEWMGKEEKGSVGRIAKVLERGITSLVGWYQGRDRKGGVVQPRNKRVDRVITVAPPAPALGVKDFDWVSVRIVEYTQPPHPLVGEIVERLGEDTDRGIDVLLVIRDLGIIEEFPPSVLKEVEKLDFDWKHDLADRTDFRKRKTITIDPKTAKDFDDALSVERLPKGGWRLWVHIADVAHFLRDGTALDEEAHERATSCYPVDRVVPMLPERLSNYLCSLVPHEDRLTMSAEIDIATSGEVTGARFHNSVIHSNHRMTYEQVQEIFDEKKDAEAPFADVVPMIRDLRDLARALRKARFERGALDLDIPEQNIIFDEYGSVADLKYYPRFESHQLVEECMLSANEAVARHLEKKKAPLLYRIHEIADEDRLEKVAALLKHFGIRLVAASGKHISQHDIQRALGKVEKMAGGHIIRRLILRALKRAEYSPVNAGHFGLASECYCHFTSPIRRYPDAQVHRQLKALLRGEPLPYPEEDNDLVELGQHCSDRERRAQQAEWEATEIKSLEYMKRHEGGEFEAWIAHVTGMGFFVELVEHPVEGFISRAQLRGDRYELDDDGVMLIGSMTGHVYKITDKVKVRVVKVDALSKKFELELLDQPELSGRRAPKNQRRRDDRPPPRGASRGDKGKGRGKGKGRK